MGEAQNQKKKKKKKETSKIGVRAFGGRLHCIAKKKKKNHSEGKNEPSKLRVPRVCSWRGTWPEPGGDVVERENLLGLPPFPKASARFTRSQSSSSSSSSSHRPGTRLGFLLRGAATTMPTSSSTTRGFQSAAGLLGAGETGEKSLRAKVIISGPDRVRALFSAHGFPTLLLLLPLLLMFRAERGGSVRRHRLSGFVLGGPDGHKGKAATGDADAPLVGGGVEGAHQSVAPFARPASSMDKDDEAGVSTASSPRHPVREEFAERSDVDDI
ncbi:MAG: hypothetical protein BJ554DRAFT_1513, partial [Olpidium bornovanus]